MTPIERAIYHCGGRQRLAEAAGVSVQAISFWVSGERQISPLYANKIHDATKGAVSRHELRPDVFGPAPESKAA